MGIPFCSPVRSVAAAGTAALLLQKNTNCTSTNLHKLFPVSSSSAATNVTVLRPQLSLSARPRQLSAPPAVQFHVSAPRPRRAPALRASGHVRCPIQPDSSSHGPAAPDLSWSPALGVRSRALPPNAVSRGRERFVTAYGTPPTGAANPGRAGTGGDLRARWQRLPVRRGGVLPPRAERYGAARGTEEAALRNAEAG